MKKLFYLLILSLLALNQLKAQSITLEQTDGSRTYTMTDKNVDLKISRSNSDRAKPDRDSDRDSGYDDGISTPSSTDYQRDFSGKYGENPRLLKKNDVNPIVKSIIGKYKEKRGIQQTYSLRNSVPVPKASHSGVPFGLGANIDPGTSRIDFEKEKTRGEMPAQQATTLWDQDADKIIQVLEDAKSKNDREGHAKKLQAKIKGITQEIKKTENTINSANLPQHQKDQFKSIQDNLTKDVEKADELLKAKDTTPLLTILTTGQQTNEDMIGLKKFQINITEEGENLDDLKAELESLLIEEEELNTLIGDLQKQLKTKQEVTHKTQMP